MSEASRSQYVKSTKKSSTSVYKTIKTCGMIRRPMYEGIATIKFTQFSPKVKWLEFFRNISYYQSSGRSSHKIVSYYVHMDGRTEQLYQVLHRDVNVPNIQANKTLSAL